MPLEKGAVEAAPAPVVPVPVVSPSPRTLRNDDIKEMEAAYQKALQHDVASQPELKNLAILSERYRTQQIERLTPLQKQVQQWADAGNAEHRRGFLARLTGLCQIMAEIRTATDPSLVKLLHTDAAAMAGDLSGRIDAMGITATHPATRTPTEVLGARYDDLGQALQQSIRSEKLPKELFNQEYLDLQMEAFIGKKLGEALDQKASPETRALRAKLQVSGVN